MSTWVKYGILEEETEDRFWFVVLKNKPVEEGYVLLCEEELSPQGMESLMEKYRCMRDVVKARELEDSFGPIK